MVAANDRGCLTVPLLARLPPGFPAGQLFGTVPALRLLIERSSPGFPPAVWRCAHLGCTQTSSRPDREQGRAAAAPGEFKSPSYLDAYSAPLVRPNRPGGWEAWLF